MPPMMTADPKAGLGEAGPSGVHTAAAASSSAPHEPAHTAPPATDDDDEGEVVEVIDHRAAADRAGFLPEFDILVRFGYAPANVFQALTTEVEHRTRDQVISMPTEFLVERVLRFIR